MCCPDLARWQHTNGQAGISWLAPSLVQLALITQTLHLSGLANRDSLAYQSAGVIYGDIGTSPLYVFSSTFTRGAPDYLDLLGALSLIIWTLTIIVTVKYVIIVLNADNEGQGGTFAMYSLLTRYVSSGSSLRLMSYKSPNRIEEQYQHNERP